MMTALARKIKRKQQLKFYKEFKKSMKKFKKEVQCSVCHRPPAPGEKVDDWHIDRNSEKIDLICVGCYEEGFRDV